MALVEVGLHLLPGIIPIQLLVYFHDLPRADIARSQNLSNKWDVIYLDVDDDVAPLWIYRPLSKVRWPVDKDEGAVSVRVMDDIGFCNPPENSYHFPTIDVIALGDSFTTCYAVNPEDTWSSNLSKLTDFSVYNLGRIGLGIHEEIQILKEFGLSKSPQFVILNVYEGNDFRDALDYNSYRQKKTEPKLLKQELFLQSLLERYSYTFNLAVALKLYWQEEVSTEFEAVSNSDSSTDIDFRYDLVFGETVIPFNRNNEDRDEVRHAQMVQNRTPAGELQFSQVVEEPLAMFVELSRQHNFTPIVTYTPSAYTAYAANVKFADPSLSEIMPAFSRYQRDFLKKEGQKLDYVFIDLTPALQEATQPTNLLYFPVNRHFTPAGHKVIAEALSQYFESAGVQ